MAGLGCWSDGSVVQMPMHKSWLHRCPAFVCPQQALKRQHSENQEIAVCHSLTERETTSTSLETTTLKAAVEQNGLSLEMNPPPSQYIGSSFTVSSVGRSNSRCLPRGLQSTLQCVSRPQELRLSMGNQLVNKCHQKESMCWGQIFPSSKAGPDILRGAELFKAKASWGTWDHAPQISTSLQRRNLWPSNLKCPLMTHIPPVSSSFWSDFVSLYLFHLAHEHHESRDPLCIVLECFQSN